MKKIGENFSNSERNFSLPLNLKIKPKNQKNLFLKRILLEISIARIMKRLGRSGKLSLWILKINSK